jgi:hypothetical protein
MSQVWAGHGRAQNSAIYRPDRFTRKFSETVAIGKIERVGGMGLARNIAMKRNTLDPVTMFLRPALCASK